MSIDKLPYAVACRASGFSLHGVARRLALALTGLWLFLLALGLLKHGAGALAPLLRVFDVSGVAGGLGLGWLFACVLLSGSPVAAVALALLAAGALDARESFAMIGGSRLGASFVVLAIGVLDDVRSGRSEPRSAYIGVAALAITAVTYLPAMALGLVALDGGALRGLVLPGHALGSWLEALHGPLVNLAGSALPRPLGFAAGLLGLLAALRLFDAALPALGAPLQLVERHLASPRLMFALGLGVTALTMSVSVSLSLLVPLTARGYLRRERVFPYILGANITTFDDTLLVAALVGHADAVRVVALLAGSVTLLTLPLVFVFPALFERWIDAIARRVSAGRRALAAYVAALLLIPLTLLAL